MVLDQLLDGTVDVGGTLALRINRGQRAAGGVVDRGGDAA